MCVLGKGRGAGVLWFFKDKNPPLKHMMLKTRFSDTCKKRKYVVSDTELNSYLYRRKGVGEFFSDQ